MARKKLDVQRSSHTLPPSPTHSFSSSSSDFEFINIFSSSPRKSSAPPPLCRTADELFYKGQLLPLHLSPRISMVRTLLLLPSSSTSSACSSYAASDTTASRDSTGSSSRDSSARPSSVLEEFDEFKRLNNTRLSSSSDVVVKQVLHSFTTISQSSSSQMKKNNSNKYFSLSRFSSVFKKDQTKQQHNRIVVEEPDHNNGADISSGSSSVKRAGNTAKEVIRRYMKKVKPLYEKLTQKQQKMTSGEIRTENKHPPINSTANRERITTTSINGLFSNSFTGNFKRRGSCVASCPSSMRCSPNHSGVLSRTGQPVPAMTSSAAVDRSSMEELQSAIQGAIAHCKNSQNNKTMFSNEI